MDAVTSILLGAILSQGFVLIWRVTRIESRITRLEVEFKNHLKYLHGVEVDDRCGRRS